MRDSLAVVELNCDNERLARAEAAALGETEATASGVAVVRGLTHLRLGLAHRVLAHIGDRPGDAEAALALVRDAVAEGRLAPTGSFRVRVRGVGGQAPSVERLEREAGAAIHAAGHPVELEDPDDEYRLVHSDGRWFLGRLLHETEGFGSRPPTENPFFKPGAMGPARARALVNLAGGHTDATVLDPMCGTGGFLGEAALVGGRPIGCDVHRDVVAGARDNLSWLAEEAERLPEPPGATAEDGAPTDPAAAALAVADARRLPLRDAAVACAVTDLPYGRASPVAAADPEALARDALAECRRVVTGRVVAVADAPLDDAATSAGYDVEDVIEDRVHRSLTRIVHVLEPA